MDKNGRIAMRIIYSCGVLGVFILVISIFTAIRDPESAQTMMWIGFVLMAPVVLVLLVGIGYSAIVSWLCWAFELEPDRFGLSEETKKYINAVLDLDMF